MRLSTTTKLLVIVATVTPVVYMALFFAGFAYTAAAGPREAGLIFDNFGIFVAVHLMVMFLMFALMTFYIVFLFKTDAVKTELKALWAVALFMGGPVAMPIFWYLYVWPSTGPRSAASAG